MPKLEWGSSGQRFFEAGIDRGVLYPNLGPGVPWDGLTAVDEKASGGDAKPYYYDGFKYLNISASEEFEATITAYSAPREFDKCDGNLGLLNGLLITQQPRESFNFSYRTRVGNDVEGIYHGYKIHLVYNALAGPSGRSNKSLGESVSPMELSWAITTAPPLITGYQPTSHFIVDSRYTFPGIMGALEDILYGTDDTDPRMPEQDEVIALINSAATANSGDNVIVSSTVPDITAQRDDTLWINTESGDYVPTRWVGDGIPNASTSSMVYNGAVVTNNTINPSFEITDIPTAEIRRNLVVSPIPNSVEWKTSPQGGFDGVGSFIDSWYSVQVTVAGVARIRGQNSPIDVTSGDTITSSYKVQSTAPVRLQFDYYLDNTYVTAIFSDMINASDEISISYTSTIPTGVNKIWVYVRADTAAVDDVIKATEFLVEKSPVFEGYFDGNTSPDVDQKAAWTGPVNASPSILYGLIPANIGGFNSSVANYQSEEWSNSQLRSVRMTPIKTTTTDTYISINGDVGAFRLGMQAGETYTAVAIIRIKDPQTGSLNVGARAIRSMYKKPDGTYVAFPYSNAPNFPGVYEVRSTFTIPIDSIEAFVRLMNGASKGGGDVWWDDFTLVHGAYDGPPFNGDTPHAWWGTGSWQPVS